MRKKRNYLIILFIILSLISQNLISCKVKDSIDEMQKLRTIEKTEDYGALSDFLRALPKNQQENAQTPYNEINTFLKGRNEILSSNYKDGFETLARFLFTYPSSYYESEASYLLGQALIFMIENNPLYVEEFYKKLITEGIVEGEENSEESNATNQSNALKNIYNQMGIIERKGVYSFNGYVFDRIVQDSESVFPLKDFAYYFSIRHRFKNINSKEDKESFITNVNYLRRFSDRYRTSVLQENILNNKSYFPESLPFELNAREKADYDNTIKTVRERIEKIKPAFEEDYYIIGNGIIIRDRIPAIEGRENELFKLYNYDFVKVLNKTNVYNARDREREDWALVRYDTYYGPIIGWSYLRYMTNDFNNIEEVFESYKSAMNNYKNYDYLKSADYFSYVLSQSETNYFTDKSVYFLWRVNNKIGELVSSKNNPYYDYVLNYPKYFYYNTNNSTLHSSTLLYNYLIKIMPSNPYRFTISGDSEAEYSVD